MTADALFSFVEELDAKDAASSKTIKGYKVNVTHHVVDQATKQQKMAILSKIVAESIRQRKNT